ncbi:bifunctional nicotinamidase/pyrazinamidase [Parapedobacter koreensis]|uniref:Nicotinamidase n=1 Tax=Parapedobacter koreensis TaxID=332977 RepID=A0A1H7SV38_9SPHI|nr:bifunctional nicotinamidase/pyrazinamidase [Parapedobacter koreensis]SEL76298.1 nicotinamidase/pyrazinamidase [Parapedobacter koreensis]
MRALIIVDVQYDFLPGGALAVPHGDRIIPVVNRLQRDFDVVVATQDWHPASHKSFASAHVGSKPFDIIDLEGLAQTLWPDHCVQGTAGAQLSEALDIRLVEAIFRKGTELSIDSYSGFFDNGKRRKTGLAGYLWDRGVADVAVCGLAADYCVYFTAMDALQLGFGTSIVEDAVRPIDESGYAAKRAAFLQQGGKLLAVGG